MVAKTEKPVTAKDIDAIRERAYSWADERNYDVDGEHIRADQILAKWQQTQEPFTGDPWQAFLNWAVKWKMEIRAGTRVRIGRTIPIGNGQTAHYEFELVAENSAMRDVAADIINRWIDELVAHSKPLQNVPTKASSPSQDASERVSAICVLTDGKGGKLWKVKTDKNPKWGVPLYSDAAVMLDKVKGEWLRGLDIGEHNVTGTLYAVVQYKGEKPTRVIDLRRDA